MPVTLIGICGKAGCGKDTLADLLCLNYDAVRYSLADPIKAGITEMFGLPAGVWENRQLKEQTIEWLGKSPRQLAQTLGTEWGRQLVCDDVWLRLAKQFINDVRPQFTVVIPDIRFNNEAVWIYENGGVVVEVTRPRVEPVAAHASEGGVAGRFIMYTVHNNGTPFDMLDKTVRMLRGPQ